MPQAKRGFYLDKIRSDSSFKVVFGQPLSMTEYLNQISPRNAQNMICKDVFMTIPVVAYAKRDFYLIDTINEKIELLTSAGLIDFWHYQTIRRELLNAKVVRTPEVLTLNQMMGCFQILVIGWIFGFIAMLSEIISNKFGNNY